MKSWKISLVFACTRMCIQRRCVKKGLGSARSKKRLGRHLFWLLFSCCWEKSNTPSKAKDQLRIKTISLQAKAYKRPSWLPHIKN